MLLGVPAHPSASCGFAAGTTSCPGHPWSHSSDYFAASPVTCVIMPAARPLFPLNAEEPDTRSGVLAMERSHRVGDDVEAGSDQPGDQLTRRNRVTRLIDELGQTIERWSSVS